jgi:hypothetical protein
MRWTIGLLGVGGIAPYIGMGSVTLIQPDALGIGCAQQRCTYAWPSPDARDDSAREFAFRGAFATESVQELCVAVKKSSLRDRRR